MKKGKLSAEIGGSLTLLKSIRVPDTAASLVQETECRMPQKSVYPLGLSFTLLGACSLPFVSRVPDPLIWKGPGLEPTSSKKRKSTQRCRRDKSMLPLRCQFPAKAPDIA
jgi:hypothetical protein